MDGAPFASASISWCYSQGWRFHVEEVHSVLALAVLGAFLAPGLHTTAHVEAVRETPPSLDYDDGERLSTADDPAIWVHPMAIVSTRASIVATLKEGGLDVYNLQGQLLQHIPGLPHSNPDYPRQRFNNVDLVYGFKLGSRSVDLAVATDHGFDRLAILEINKSGSDAAVPLTEVTKSGLPFVFAANQSEVNAELTVMGIGTAKLWRTVRPSLSSRAAIARRSPSSGCMTPVAVKSVTRRWCVSICPHRSRCRTVSSGCPCQDEDGLTPMSEGTVIDRDHGYVYIGPETVGLWRTTLV